MGALDQVFVAFKIALMAHASPETFAKEIVTARLFVAPNGAEAFRTL